MIDYPYKSLGETPPPPPPPPNNHSATKCSCNMDYLNNQIQ